MNDAPIVDPTINEVEVTEIPIGATTDADSIDNGAATKDDTVSIDIKEENPTTIEEMMEEAEAAATAAGSDLRKENTEESAVAPAPTLEDNKDAQAADVKEDISEVKVGISEDQTGEPIETMADAKVELSNETETPMKETKKRVRRVGRTPTRKIPKLEETALSMDVDVGDNNNAHEAAVAVDAATAAIGTIPEMVRAVAIESLSTITVAPPTANQGVLSKHDEKWHAMFEKLMEFKESNKHTLVPQCYTEDPRLGRWVHYQRVEFWIFQQKGTAKITEERIARLNNIGFEWDPQKAQWEKMFAKLKEFKKEFSHCRVPKGYDKDWELANWVRNQRLEQANLSKEGKKSRMTPERFKLLDDLGFKWSSPTPARARRNRQAAKKFDGSSTEGQKIASCDEIVPMLKSDNAVSVATPDSAVPDADSTVAAATTAAITVTVNMKDEETLVSAQAEAMTAATNVVGNLSAVEVSTKEENSGFEQDAIEEKTADKQEIKTEAQATVPQENETSVIDV